MSLILDEVHLYSNHLKLFGPLFHFGMCQNVVVFEKSEAVSDTMGVIIFGGNEFEDEQDVVDEDRATIATDDPLVQVVALLSVLTDPGRYPQLAELRKKELELRCGLANDLLSDIRQTVSQLLFQWRKGIRQAPDKVRTTQARLTAAAICRRLALQAKFYNQVRGSMQ